MDAYYRYTHRAWTTYALGTLAAVGMGALLFRASLALTRTGWLVFIVSLGIGSIPMFIADAAVTGWYLRPIRQFVSERDPSLGPQAAARVRSLPAMAALRTVGPHFFALMVPGVAVGVLLSRHYPVGATPAEIVLVGAAAFGISVSHAVFEYLMANRGLMTLLVLTRPYEPEVSPTHRLNMRSTATIVAGCIGAVPVVLMATTAYPRFFGPAGFTFTSYIWWAATASGMGLLFAFSAALVLAHTVSDPVLALLRGMRAVSVGQPTPPLPEQHYIDEFAEMARGFNRLVAVLQERLENERTLADSLISVLTTALEARDPYTRGHSERVSRIAVCIADRLGVPEAERNTIRRAALMHDIGKIGIEDTVLRKEGKLEPEEYEMMKRHPAIGAAILGTVRPPIQAMRMAVLHHHERIDGHGYPAMLRGEDIPLASRIIAVADAYDAMTSDRPYRRGYPPLQARKILSEGAGSQWDPDVVSAFLALPLDVVAYPENLPSADH